MEFTAEQQAYINARIEEAKTAAITTANAEIESKLAAARREEKEKLYGRISILEEESKTNSAKIQVFNNQKAEYELKLQEMVGKAAEQETALAKAKEEYAELEKKKGAATMDEETKKAYDEKIAKMEELVMKQSTDIEAMKKDTESAKLQQTVASHRATKIRDLDETFHTFVTGNTVEEVDKSFEAAKAAQESLYKKNPALNPKPPASALQNTLMKDISIEELSKLDVRSKEYKEMHDKLVAGGLLRGK